MLKGLTRKILFWLATGSSTLMVACAYGFAAEYRLTGVRKFRCVDAQNNAPIPGLKVSLLEMNVYDVESEGELHWSTTTDSAGVAVLEVWDDTTDRFDELTENSWRAKIEDVDGEINGGVYSETLLEVTPVRISESADYGDTLEIRLPKER